MLPVMVAETDAGWHPRHDQPITLLIGQKLEYVQLGHAIILSFTGGRQVLIETVARLSGRHGEAHVEPGENPSDILATVLGEVVLEARADATGELRITFGSGSELRVSAEPDVESWAVSGPDGILIVCVARGELAIWSDVHRARDRERTMCVPGMRGGHA